MASGQHQVPVVTCLPCSHLGCSTNCLHLDTTVVPSSATDSVCRESVNHQD